jgi:hypothetical protein
VLRSELRRGATTVELAMVLPVFLIFLFGLIEFGRLQLVINVMRNGARQSARYGATDGVTSAEALAWMDEILAAAMDVGAVSSDVKDATVYDSGDALPANPDDFDGLPGIELSTAEPRQLFLVRASIPYNEVALIPMEVLDGVVLRVQAFMRHE